MVFGDDSEEGVPISVLVGVNVKDGFRIRFRSNSEKE